MTLEVLSWIYYLEMVLCTFASIICAALANLFEKKRKYFKSQICNDLMFIAARTAILLFIFCIGIQILMNY